MAQRGLGLLVQLLYIYIMKRVHWCNRTYMVTGLFTLQPTQPGD